jgi:hypothetical protein
LAAPSFFAAGSGAEAARGGGLSGVAFTPGGGTSP